jgi:hypothetical protein
MDGAITIRVSLYQVASFRSIAVRSEPQKYKLAISISTMVGRIRGTVLLVPLNLGLLQWSEMLLALLL